MITVTETSTLKCPLERAFDLAADPDQQLRWDAGTLRAVEKLTTGPLGKGSRYRGTFKGFGTFEYEFVEYEAPRTFAHRTRMQLGDMLHRFTFEPVPEGTRLTQQGQLSPNLLGRVMSSMFKRKIAKRFRSIADELGAYLGTDVGGTGALN